MQNKFKSIHFYPLIGVFFALFLSGCVHVKFPGVYRIAVQQGNIIDRKKVNQLELGMTKRQVNFVMGSPLVNDVFHEDRWDYAYQVRKGEKSLRDRRFTLFFEDDKLIRWEGDYEPKPEVPVDDEYIIEDAKKT